MTDRTVSHAPDLDATKARQGAWGQDVFWVLAFSTALAVIILAVAWIYRAPSLARVHQTAQSPAVAAQFHTPPQAQSAPALEKAP